MNGRGRNRSSSGFKGRGGGPLAAGPGGQCVCPSCGHRQEHRAGQPCNSLQCPKCGAGMIRE